MRIKIFHSRYYWHDYDFSNLEKAINQWRMEAESDEHIRNIKEETIIGEQESSLCFVFHYDEEHKYDFSSRYFLEVSMTSALTKLLLHLEKYTETGKIVWAKTARKKYDTIVKPDGNDRAELVTLTAEEDGIIITLTCTVPEIEGMVDLENWRDKIVVAIKKENESVQKETLRNYYTDANIAICRLIRNIKKQLAEKGE